MSSASQILQRIAQKLLDQQKQDVRQQGANSNTILPSDSVSSATAVPLSSTTHVSAEISTALADFVDIKGKGESPIRKIIQKVLKMSQEELCARPGYNMNEDCIDKTGAGRATTPVTSWWVFDHLWILVSCVLVAGIIVIVVTIIICRKYRAGPANKSAAKQQQSFSRVQQFLEDVPGMVESNVSVDYSTRATRGSDIQFGLTSAERHDLLVSGYLSIHRRELQARGLPIPAPLYETVEEANAGSDVLSRICQQESQTDAGGAPSLLYRTVDCTGEVSFSYGDLIQVIKSF